MSNEPEEKTAGSTRNLPLTCTATARAGPTAVNYLGTWRPLRACNWQGGLWDKPWLLAQSSCPPSNGASVPEVAGKQPAGARVAQKDPVLQSWGPVL